MFMSPSACSRMFQIRKIRWHARHQPAAAGRRRQAGFRQPGQHDIHHHQPGAAGCRRGRQGARRRRMAEIRRATHLADRERQPTQPVAEERGLGARRVHHGGAGARQCDQRAVQRDAAQKRCAVSEGRQQHRVRSEQAVADFVVRGADRQDLGFLSQGTGAARLVIVVAKASTACSRQAARRAS